jgi:hypothetical protein
VPVEPGRQPRVTTAVKLASGECDAAAHISPRVRGIGIANKKASRSTAARSEDRSRPACPG